MDTSELYIKMSDCPEIQEQRHSFVMADPTSVVKGKWVEGVDGGEIYAPRQTFLPRQDQLQEMVWDNKEQLSQPAGIFRYLGYEFKNGKDQKYYNSFTSMEQLWLAFMMKEKFNKVWDSEKWS